MLSKNIKIKKHNKREGMGKNHSKSTGNHSALKIRESTCDPEMDSGLQKRTARKSY